MKMFIIKINSPNVKSIRGAEIILSIGFMKKFNNPITVPAIRRSRISPVNETPSIKRAAIYTASELPRM